MYRQLKCVAADNLENTVCVLSIIIEFGKIQLTSLYYKLDVLYINLVYYSFISFLNACILCVFVLVCV